MFDLFVSTAWAMGGAGGQGGGEGAGGGGWLSILPLVLMFGIFYLLLIRPQQKKAKAHKAMLASLKKGDDVVTGGGIYGKITGITDTVVVVEIAPQVRVKVNRGQVAGLVSAVTEPPQAAKDKK